MKGKKTKDKIQEPNKNQKYKLRNPSSRRGGLGVVDPTKKPLRVRAGTVNSLD